MKFQYLSIQHLLILQVLEVRSIHHHISQLLSKFEKEELKITDNFKVFSGTYYFII